LRFNLIAAIHNFEIHLAKCLFPRSLLS
jgi:hypothetical protein